MDARDLAVGLGGVRRPGQLVGGARLRNAPARRRAKRVVEAAVFFVCAGFVLAGALGVILARNPVHSALYLLMSLVSVAILFLQLHAALVAAIQIVVYASAIVVLFLFVITLLGVDRHESLHDSRRFQLPTALVLGALLFIGILTLASNNWVTGGLSTRGA